MTRQQVIKQLLQQQEAEKPPPERHEFEETTGDMKCARCGCSVHKRCNEQTFQAFVEGPCLDRAYVLPHEGHASHALWQKGTKVTCAHCGLSLHLDGQNRIILTGAIRKPCKGAAIGGSPPLTEYFRSQPSQAAHQATRQLEEASRTGTEVKHTDSVQSQPQPQQQPTALGLCPQPEVQHGRPTPRRLHFPTDLDGHEQQAEQDSLAREEPNDTFHVGFF